MVTWMSNQLFHVSSLNIASNDTLFMYSLQIASPSILIIFDISSIIWNKVNYHLYETLASISVEALSRDKSKKLP